MNAQVVPLSAMGTYADYHYWVDQGWKSAAITIVIIILIFAVYKGKISIASFGPNEAGIRELLGVPLYRIGSGPHLDIDGFWKARRASTARVQVDLRGEFSFDRLTWVYDVVVKMKVDDTKQGLSAFIYTAQDLNRENMENSEAIKQVTSLLRRELRILLEKHCSATKAEHKLAKAVCATLLDDYGFVVVSVEVNELVKRPQSELAEAIRDSGSLAPIAAINATTADVVDFQSARSETA